MDVLLKKVHFVRSQSRQSAFPPLGISLVAPSVLAMTLFELRTERFKIQAMATVVAGNALLSVSRVTRF